MVTRVVEVVLVTVTMDVVVVVFDAVASVTCVVVSTQEDLGQLHNMLADLTKGCTLLILAFEMQSHWHDHGCSHHNSD